MPQLTKLIVFVCLLPVCLSAQKTDGLSGAWTGILLQNEGGIADRFELYFDLQQIGISLQGKAFVQLGELMAEMKLRGYQSNSGAWHITETQILRSNKAGLEVSWCMKQYELRVDYKKGEQVLSGPWWGNSEYGPCIPGSITLRRKVKVASLLLGGEHRGNVEPHG